MFRMTTNPDFPCLPNIHFFISQPATASTQHASFNIPVQ